MAKQVSARKTTFLKQVAISLKKQGVTLRPNERFGNRKN